jgi:Fur family zinc uptake transcriptional regulator
MTLHPAPELTKNQTLVLAALTQAHGPLSAYAILDRLRDRGIRAPLQVYRALDRLIASGMVHRLESLNAFVACRHSGCDAGATQAFAICEKCGEVAELANDRLDAEIGRIAGGDGFRPRKATVEISGLCRACAS